MSDIKRLGTWIAFWTIALAAGCLLAIAFAYFINGI